MVAALYRLVKQLLTKNLYFERVNSGLSLIVLGDMFTYVCERTRLQTGCGVVSEALG